MTAPNPSGAITGDTAACTAAALLTADPPEIGAVREALHLAFAAGQPAVTVAAYDLSEVLATVDYLRATRRPPGGEG